MRRFILFAAMFAVLSGCASTPGSTDLLTLMKQVIDPAANQFWAASGEVETEEGAASRSPQTEAKWRETAKAAAAIEQNGKRLLEPPHARAEEDWTRFAAMMAQAGAEGVKAAELRNAEAAFEAGGKLYEACAGCHAKYIPGRS